MGSEKNSKHEFIFLNSTLKYALGLDWFLFYYISWFIPTKSCWFLSSISTNEERIWRIRSSFYNPSRVEQAIFRAQSTYIKHSLIAIIFIITDHHHTHSSNMAQFQISPEIPRRLEIWRDPSPLYCKPMGRKDVAYPVSMVVSGNAGAAPPLYMSAPPLSVITLKWAWANFSFCCYWKGTLSSFQPLIQFKHSHKKRKYGLCVIYSDLKF